MQKVALRLFEAALGVEPAVSQIPTARFRGLVAQVSQPAVSRVSKPAAPRPFASVRFIRSPADLEVGDTAGWETCATGSRFEPAQQGALDLGKKITAPDLVLPDRHFTPAARPGETHNYLCETKIQPDSFHNPVFSINSTSFLINREIRCLAT
jgi:hypothetical protein